MRAPRLSDSLFRACAHHQGRGRHARLRRHPGARARRRGCPGAGARTRRLPAGAGRAAAARDRGPAGSQVAGSGTPAGDVIDELAAHPGGAARQRGRTAGSRARAERVRGNGASPPGPHGPIRPWDRPPAGRCPPGGCRGPLAVPRKLPRGQRRSGAAGAGREDRPSARPRRRDHAVPAPAGSRHSGREHGCPQQAADALGAGERLLGELKDTAVGMRTAPALGDHRPAAARGPRPRP